MDVVVDDEEVDEIDQGLGEIGVGRQQTSGLERGAKTVYGASNADNNFVDRFNKEKTIEKELKAIEVSVPA